MIAQKSENPEGLHQRYHVQKVEGETDPNAVYLVLRLDPAGVGDDPIWNRICRSAARHIAAELLETGHMLKVATDLQTLVNRLESPDW